MISRRSITAVLLLTCSALLNAQEVKYIDLTLVQQRTQLRHPPAPAQNCEKGTQCGAGGYGGVGIGEGAPDRRDPHALGIYLLTVSPTEINPAEAFEAEFRVLNTGIAPLEIPVSPHLSDLQPGDAGTAFSYFSLALVVHVSGEPQGPDVATFGSVELYGSPDHDGTMLELRPGEWIHVRAKVKLRSWPLQPVSARFRGEFWLHRNTFTPHPGGEFTTIQNLYPNVTSTPWIPVRLLPPTRTPEPTN